MESEVVVEDRQSGDNGGHKEKESHRGIWRKMSMTISR